jgi:hypothetical protein
MMKDRNKPNVFRQITVHLKDGWNEVFLQAMNNLNLFVQAFAFCTLIFQER